MNSDANPKLSAAKICQNSYPFKRNFTGTRSCLPLNIMDTERTLECHLIIYVLLITRGRIHRETCRTNCSRGLERVTHHAFLHNAKYFFKSLYYNSETLTVRSCRIISKCNKVPDNNLSQLKTFDNCI